MIGDSRRERGGARNLRSMARVHASVVNPLVRLAFRLGIGDPCDALIETPRSLLIR